MGSVKQLVLERKMVCNGIAGKPIVTQTNTKGKRYHVWTPELYLNEIAVIPQAFMSTFVKIEGTCWSYRGWINWHTNALI
jgi:hypothetical protein